MSLELRRFVRLFNVNPYVKALSVLLDVGVNVKDFVQTNDNKDLTKVISLLEDIKQAFKPTQVDSIFNTTELLKSVKVPASPAAYLGKPNSRKPKGDEWYNGKEVENIKKSLLDNIIFDKENVNSINTENTKGILDVLIDGFALNNDLLAIIAKPSNPIQAFNDAYIIKSIREISQFEAKEVYEKNVAQKTYESINKLEKQRDLVKYLDEKYKEAFDKYDNAHISNPRKKVYREEYDEQKEIRSEAVAALQRMQIEESLTLKQYVIDELNKYELQSEKWFHNRFGQENSIPQENNYSANPHVNFGNNGILPMLGNNFAINTENISVKAENINVSMDENSVKTVTGNSSDVSLQAKDMLSLPGSIQNNVNNDFRLGGVIVNVSQIAQISDELVYQVFNRVGDLVKEHMAVCTEGG